MTPDQCILILLGLPYIQRFAMVINSDRKQTKLAALSECQSQTNCVVSG